MGYTRDRDEFVHLMTKEGMALNHIQEVMFLSNKIQLYATFYCNRELSAYEEKRYEDMKIRIRCLGVLYNTTPVFSGDPRGACVKLKVPSGKTNDWGAEGICVPTRNV